MNLKPIVAAVVIAFSASVLAQWSAPTPPAPSADRAKAEALWRDAEAKHTQAEADYAKAQSLWQQAQAKRALAEAEYAAAQAAWREKNKR